MSINLEDYRNYQSVESTYFKIVSLLFLAVYINYQVVKKPKLHETTEEVPRAVWSSGDTFCATRGYIRWDEKIVFNPSLTRHWDVMKNDEFWPSTSN